MKTKRNINKRLERERKRDITGESNTRKITTISGMKGDNLREMRSGWERNGEIRRKKRSGRMKSKLIRTESDGNAITSASEMLIRNRRREKVDIREGRFKPFMMMINVMLPVESAHITRLSPSTMSRS